MQINRVTIIVITLFVLFSVSIFLANRYPATAPTHSSTLHPTLTEKPTMTPATASPSASENIIVTSPKPNEKLILPFAISGKARVFENQFSYRIMDGKGAIVASGSAMSDAKDAGVYGNFSIIIRKLLQTTSKKGLVIVYDNSPKDGSEIDVVHIPVELP